MAGKMKLRLHRMGFTHCAVCNGDDIFQKIEAFKPDLALVDVKGANGSDNVDLAQMLYSLYGLTVVFFSVSPDTQPTGADIPAKLLGYTAGQSQEKRVKSLMKMVFNKMGI